MITAFLLGIKHIFFTFQSTCNTVYTATRTFLDKGWRGDYTVHTPLLFVIYLSNQLIGMRILLK